MFDVVVDGADVHVDVYGGPRNVCGSIRFRFPNRDDRRRKVEALRRWQQQSTPLTFVSNGSTITLQNDIETYGSQLQSS